MKRPLRPLCSALLAAACFVSPMSSASAEVIASNLNQPIDGIEKITNRRWLASQFSTDDATYLLSSVTLRLQRNTGGTVEAAIFTDAGGRPGELVGILSPNGQFFGFPSDVSFTSKDGTTSFSGSSGTITLSGSFEAPSGVNISDLPAGEFSASGERPAGLTLAPNETYWIVTRALSGEFASAYTDSEQGQGPGYSSLWAASENAGGSWQTQPISPLFFGVFGDPTQILVEFRTDLEAIQSTVFSALPTALAQRELTLAAVEEVTRDVNARLFRLRAGDAVQPGWEVFASGQYGANDTDAIGLTSGFQADIWSANLGAEYHLNRNLTLGVALTLVESDSSLGSGIADVKLSGPALAAYVSYAKDGFYADVLYSYTSLDHEIRRNTLFGDTALAAPNSETHTIEVNFGHNFEVRGWTTGPLASVRYSNGDIDEYTESGADTANVKVAGQNYESLVTRLGWQISRVIQWGTTELIPQLHFAWRREWLNNSDDLAVSLLQSPFAIGNGDTFEPVGSFSAASRTHAPGEDSLELGASLGVQLSERFTVYLQYEARVFQGDSTAHGVSLTGSFKF